MKDETYKVEQDFQLKFSESTEHILGYASLIQKCDARTQQFPQGKREHLSI